MKNYFKDSELYYSYTAEQHQIDNSPSQEVINRLLHIRDKYLNQIRESYGGPIRISSGYRCDKLNKMVGGSSTSNHLFGEAIDIVPIDGNVNKLFLTIKDYLEETKLPYDELFFERNSRGSVWVHFAVRQRQGTPNRSKMARLNVK